MQNCSPWGIKISKVTKFGPVKSVSDPIPGTKTVEQIDDVIYLCAEALRICGILLQPYMPSKMGKLLDMLGVDPSARGLENATFQSDADYGTPNVDLGRGHEGVLFPPLRSDD